MDDQKNQLINKLKSANNILVTVSTNPSVDQLTACIGMTIWLNKANKHATAVFSGDIPNALEFLQPEATLEKTTDSLRDFIIALDRSKADKLRYKLEDRVVKIFITPYRTILTPEDLEFSQGDFNVDAIVALGVNKQEDLDNAIVAHGRILHDATVTTVNLSNASELGAINWNDPSASSLAELVYEVGKGVDVNQLDPQIATALLTGIVAETERFSNSKTTPNTMSVAAALMKAGANQQLVASKLQQSGVGASPTAPDDNHPAPPAAQENSADQAANGMLEISHEHKEEPEPAVNDESPASLPKVQPLNEESPTSASSPAEEAGLHSTQTRITEPPAMGGAFTANSIPEDIAQDSVASPLDLPPEDNSQLLKRKPLLGSAPTTPEPPAPVIPIPDHQPPAGNITPSEANPPIVDENETLTEIEQAVKSPHLDAIRNQVEDAFKAGPQPNPGPIEALNAVNIDLGDNQPAANANPLAFNPQDFGLDDSDNEDRPSGGPPQVPPPIVPPDMLPPA